MSAAPRLRLLTRAECDLCHEMHEALERLRIREGLPPCELFDVDADPVLRRRYGLKVPVLLLDDVPVCHGHLDIEALRRALAARRPPDQTGR